MAAKNEREDLPPRGQGEKPLFESFDYNHQSRHGPNEPKPHPSVGREVFDYHHGQPPHPPPGPWRGIPPAPLIPAPPPHQMPPLLPPPDVAAWGAPPPPNLPPPPADLPPPIPYYDLPAGIMVALVPVSVQSLCKIVCFFMTLYQYMRTVEPLYS